MPPAASSSHVSDCEEGPDDDEGGPEVDDSDILADFPDDTDVRRSPPPSQQHVIADLPGFVHVIRILILYTHD